MSQKGYLIFCFLAVFLSTTKGESAYEPRIEKLLKAAQAASYVDSLKLFTIGERLIAESTKKPNDAAAAQVKIFYGNYFFYVRNLAMAESYYEEALALAKKNKAYKVARLAQIRLAYLQFENGNSEQSEKDLKELLFQSKKESDQINIAEILNLIGIIEESKNNSKEAARLYIEGLTMAELFNLPYYQAVFYNNLGLIKLSSGQNEQAMADFEKGLILSERENNERLTSHIRMNICLVLTHTGDLTQVFKLFNKAIEYDRKNNLQLELSTNYVNFGSALLRNNETSAALSYYDSAVYVLNKSGLRNKLNTALLGKANVLVQIGKLDEALTLLQAVRDSLTKTNLLEDWVSFHELKYRIYAVKKQYEDAFKEHIIYTQFQDSLNNNLNIKIVEELQLKYKSQKKEVELEREKSKSLALEKINQGERFTKWLVVFISLIVIIIIFVLFYTNYNKKIREKQKQFSRQLIENIEEERKRIAMDLHDDIGQSLSIIKAKVLNEKLRNIPPSTETENELTRVIQQTREISKGLYPSHLEKIGLLRSVAALFESIQLSLHLECSYEISNEVEKLPINYKTHIFRIIQECTNNTIKHSGATGLKLFMNPKGEMFELIYQDNGYGIRHKKSDLGIGIFSMKERAKIINGTIEINEKATKGFRLSLEFKNPSNI